MLMLEAGLVNSWLRHVKEVANVYADQLDAVSDPLEKENLMVELNVRHQVLNLCKVDVIQRMWRKNAAEHGKGDADIWSPNSMIEPRVHGWVYEVGTGMVKDLAVDISQVPNVFRLNANL